MSTTWIRNNMLHIDDKCDRKLTEAELRVQRSLERLSIPDWYLNKYTSSPKLLNTKPFEFRSSPWKNFTPQKNCTLDSFSSLSDVERNLNEKTQNAASPVTKMPIDKNTCHEQKLPSTNRKRHVSKEEEIFNIDLPMAKYPRKRYPSKTFPKKSPSRKIANLNLVLPPGPKIDFSKEFESTYMSDDDNLFTKKLKASKKISKQNDATERSRQKENVFQVPTTPIKPAGTEFNIRATSTPNSSFVMSGPKKLKRVPCDLATKDFSTFQQDSMNRAMNLLNTSKNIPKSRKLSPNILEKTFIFENSELNSSHDCNYARPSSDKLLLERNIQLNDSVRAKASIFESNSSLDNFNRSYIISSSNKERLLPMADVRPSKSVREKTFIYESNSSIDQINAKSSFNKLPRRNIRLTELVREKAAFFESNISLNSCDQSYTKPSFNKVKPLSTKNNQTIDLSMNNFDQSYAETSSESLNIRSDNSLTGNLITPIEFHPLIRKLIKLEDSYPPRSQLRRRTSRYDTIRSLINMEAKMLTADKKLPNICSREKRRNSDEQWSYTKFLGLRRKNRQSNRENSIQEIIQNFEKARISESRCGRSSELNEDFTRQLVDVKKGDTSAIKKMTRRDEEDDCSESETKSYVTSTFFQDMDTSIDTSYDQRPPTPKCDEKKYSVKNITTTMANLTVETEKKTEEEGDDFVYWIPIRKLPRSSSLLSVISKISSNCYSPCISPIKDEDDVEFSQKATCETTSKENVAKKPFKIDETVVIDSGYSDRSERSVLNSMPSAADDIWYDDFESIRKFNNRRKWSPKPISIAGYTYSVR